MRFPSATTLLLLLPLVPACADPVRPLEPIAGTANAGRQPTWTATTLPLPPNNSLGGANDINRWGLSVGWAGNGIGSHEVAVGWNITFPMVIPQLSGTGGWDHRAMAANDSGIVVGYSRHNTATRMWKWSLTGGIVELFGNIGEVTPEGSNIGGSIVGHGGRVTPFVLADLGSPAGWTGSSNAHDISADLRVVGVFNFSAWTVYQGIHVVLPTPNLAFSRGLAVNRCGWIVGEIDFEPVLWRPSFCDS